MLFKKVVIVGVGLIGASLGRVIKEKNLAESVFGIVHRKETIAKAIKINAIDAGSLDSSCVKNADLVIFATPVETIIKLAKKVKNLLPDGCVVIDVGSTKKEIVNFFDRIFKKNIQFLGCHPLAGLEKKGLESSRVNLFDNSITILTPFKNRVSKSNFEKIEKLWQVCGSKTVILSPDNHDRIIAYTSDLPHILAFSLINAMPKDCLKFVAGGFKDTTRIGASNPQMWNDILISNKKEVLSALNNWQKKVNELKKYIQSKNQKRIKSYILTAKQTRENI